VCITDRNPFSIHDCDEYQIRAVPGEIMESFYVDEILMKLRIETDEQREDSEIAWEGRTSDTEQDGNRNIEALKFAQGRG
jgi:hypothetical protein